MISVFDRVENIVGKGENLVTSIFYISYNLFKDGILCKSINPLPDNKILDWSNLKPIADDILKCIYNGK